MKPCYSDSKDQENDSKQFNYAMEVEGSSVLPMVLKASGNSGWLGEKVATETKRRQVETQNGLVGKLHHFFTTSPSLAFRYVVGRKLKDIEKRLDEIVLEMNNFKFLVEQVGRPIETFTRDETHSFVNTLMIVGSEIDKEKIVSLLLFSNYKENVPIIPIVGMGGLGKTTLAQLVYNDHRIQNHFPKRVFWACISDDFNIERILVKILQAGGANCSNSGGLENLQNQVRNMLSVNQFLLFLDDVWNEDIVEWKTLENFLITGARGSRIVVTTRSKEVASIVKTGTIIPYELGGLSEDQCLEILVKWAFKEGANKHENLVNIGREIVKKCGGVPLAARTLGAMLHSKTNEGDWKSVRDSEMWALAQKKNDILPILKSSYDQMPPFLKHCFACCSLFEKDEVIDGNRLIYHWMAQGFLQCSDREKELEDIGEGYILELHLAIGVCPPVNWSDGDYDLKGLKSLKKLGLYSLPKLVTLPKGLQDVAATLTHLAIIDYESFTLPSECILPNLQSLEIEDCCDFESLPEGMQCLTKLQFLRISGCNLATSSREGGEDWHKIAHIPTTELLDLFRGACFVATFVMAFYKMIVVLSLHFVEVCLVPMLWFWLLFS
ncbi:hypothetical protein Vadar_007412 [Vaccinium darrowii]|uniref:Uncharacterized protein n=1 Tax=Vaccinium darrowii TaxID=229202 RepID=A0ACB7YL06_9ERIC|nr:hypothetical protein Vadar_007412 [Vaccinium darrowii]